MKKYRNPVKLPWLRELLQYIGLATILAVLILLIRRALDRIRS